MLYLITYSEGHCIAEVYTDTLENKPMEILTSHLVLITQCGQNDALIIFGINILKNVGLTLMTSFN